MKITPVEFDKRMKAVIAGSRDPEVQHGDADDLLVETLTALGYDLTEYEALMKWYA